MAQIQVEIHEEIGNLSESKGWKKQLTYTSWNNHAPKFDIRSWNEDHSSMTKGITLNKEELNLLQIAGGSRKAERCKPTLRT